MRTVFGSARRRSKPLIAGSGPAALAALAAMALASPALAGLSVNPLVIDLAAGDAPRGDVELRNTGEERLYVRIEPFRIEHPGRPDERRVTDPDPSVLGLLASPGQVILEPGQRKFLRVATLASAGQEDRVFRVTIKPVAGDVQGQQTGLKLLVGYDMLVIQRPATPLGVLTGRRTGSSLVVTNTGNTNVELFRGQRCGAGGKCVELPSERIYAGQSVALPCSGEERVKFVQKVNGAVSEVAF